MVSSIISDGPGQDAGAGEMPMISYLMMMGNEVVLMNLSFLIKSIPLDAPTIAFELPGTNLPAITTGLDDVMVTEVSNAVDGTTVIANNL